MAGANLRTILRGLGRELDGAQPRLNLALSVCRRLPMCSFVGVRLRILRWAGVRIGEGSGVAGELRIGGGSGAARRVSIGERCFLNDGCRLDASAPISIGDDVYIGHDVALLTASHEHGELTRRAGALTSRPIIIERGAWIGARAVVLPGVKIGAGSVVAAGAVVHRDVQPSTLVGGVPARHIRSYEHSERGVRASDTSAPLATIPFPDHGDRAARSLPSLNGRVHRGS